MNRKWFLLLVAALITSPAWAQNSATAHTDTSAQASASASKSPGAQASGNASANASAEAGNNSAGLETGTTFDAVLSKSLDARKNKAGDEVVARSEHAVKSDSRIVIPKGAKLIGHVTDAEARGKSQSQSTLGLMFDRAILKNGQEVPLHVVIQAVAAAQSQASPAGGDDNILTPMGGSGATSGSGSGRANVGLLGGAASTVGSTAGAATQATGSLGSTVGGATNGTLNSAVSATGAGGLDAKGLLTSTSSGVFGLRGTTLTSQASNGTQGSVLVSSDKNVHLESGTRLLLRAEKP
ncbi:MAG: TrbI/VirB10 family protein [Acidipila sp.]|nr:TrbI/VirB10 family protein [Acidipila sp.]